MKYISKIIKIISVVFGAATAMMLVYALIPFINGKLVDRTFGYYLGILYMIILAVTILALIIAIPMGMIRNIKMNGLKKFLLRTAMSFAIGVVLAILLSLIKYKNVFSANLLYIPIAFGLMPSAGYMFIGDHK